PSLRALAAREWVPALRLSLCLCPLVRRRAARAAGQRAHHAHALHGSGGPRIAGYMAGLRAPGYRVGRLHRPGRRRPTRDGRDARAGPAAADHHVSVAIWRVLYLYLAANSVTCETG